jgi:steroid delta-isomerase-like uncharacterized protein
VTAAANKALVRRYYEEMWNRWDLSLARELLAPDLRFRGSLGTEANGIGEFCAYARSVWLALPDFHNQIEGMIAEGDRVVALITYTGTHRGEVLGIGATGRRVEYEGIAMFHIADAKIAEVYVVADRLGLVEELQASVS